PPVGRPVQYRVGGPDIQTVRELAQQFAGVISANPKLAAPTFDWNEPQRVLRVDVLQDKARQLGITSSDIASALNSTVGGATITQVRDATYLINVVARSRGSERGSIETLQNMQLP
ncbi:MAG: efflux RND transporter permease subunit, partial [Mesorhizobium sp.]